MGPNIAPPRTPPRNSEPIMEVGIARSRGEPLAILPSKLKVTQDIVGQCWSVPTLNILKKAEALQVQLEDTGGGPFGAAKGSYSGPW